MRRVVRKCRESKGGNGSKSEKQSSFREEFESKAKKSERRERLANSAEKNFGNLGCRLFL